MLLGTACNLYWHTEIKRVSRDIISFISSRALIKLLLCGLDTLLSASKCVNTFNHVSFDHSKDMIGETDIILYGNYIKIISKIIFKNDIDGK